MDAEDTDVNNQPDQKVEWRRPKRLPRREKWAAKFTRPPKKPLTPFFIYIQVISCFLISTSSVKMNMLENIVFLTFVSKEFLN